MFTKSTVAFVFCILTALFLQSPDETTQSPSKLTKGAKLSLFLSGDALNKFAGELGKTDWKQIQIQGTVVAAADNNLTIRASMENREHDDGVRMVSLLAAVDQNRIEKFKIAESETEPATSGLMIRLDQLDDVTIETWKRINTTESASGG